MKRREWFGLYRESWQGEIVPDAFAHPAKFSRALIRRIYQHALQQGYVKAGDVIADPFGGVALGALDAMRYGLHWRGVELEERFVKLGNENLALWQQRYEAAFPGWGTARLLQGDSRRLCDVLGMADLILSSPPYSVTSAANQGNNQRRFADPSYRPKERDGDRYGESNGQLANYPEGDVDAAISSPPYADSVDGTGEGPGARWDFVHHNGDNATKRSSDNGYGATPGNLGAMADGVVSSPPYTGLGADIKHHGIKGHARVVHDVNYGNAEYGSSEGQLGNNGTDTFWTAAKTIVEQVHAILRPGGVAIFVTGDYVRDGQRVEFGNQWLQLCQACGFSPLEWITCWKREPGPVQLALVGDDHDHTIDRVSFFRRLANRRNPAAAILNEDVLIVRKEAR